MATVKEAFANHDRAVEDFVEGARLDVGLEAMCALEEDEERTLRELLLAVHVEACGHYKAVERPGAPMGMGPKCGQGGYYCEQAKAIKELGDGQG